MIEESKKYATQDQALADEITAARQLIISVRDDPEIAPLVAVRGLDADKLAEGLGLQETTQITFNGRQEAMAGQVQATAALEEVDASAWQTYQDFRATGRAFFTNPAARLALSLSGNTPRDRQKFITHVSASYAAARLEPYQATFAGAGYPLEALDAAQATLEALIAADQVQDAAIAAAKQATADRDAAGKVLRQWVRQLKTVAKIALRNRPDLADRLQL